MITTFSFVERLFAKAADFEKRGMITAACRTYQRLLHIKSLTRRMRGEAAGQLGKLQLRRGQFAEARRHLTLAIDCLPRNVPLQNRLAKAIEADESCAAGQVEYLYRNCLKLRPNNPRYLIDLARYLTQSRPSDEAVDLLQRAYMVGAENLQIVADVVEGLRDMGKIEEAESILRKAQFRHRRDPGFQSLWVDHRFQLLWSRQQAMQVPAEQERAILRFVRSTHKCVAR